MKITDIQIEHFGVWQDLVLRLPGSGLNVIYGPNEAGKTTLMRFIRSLLYGFEQFGIGASKGQSQRIVWEGSLIVDERGKQFEIRRGAQRGTRGLVSMPGSDAGTSDEELLSRLLSETEEKVFQHVFAIGLQELQELATLHDSDVAHHIYGMTLGPDGQRLLDVLAQAESERNRLFDPETQNGKLAKLLQRDQQLTAQLETLENAGERHSALCHDCGSREAEIAELKTRQAGLQSQLRGHLFLERIWTPWKQVREQQRELDALPVVTGFPEEGRARLDKLEAELDSVNRCRNVLLAEAGQFRKEAETLHIDPEFEKHSATIQCFLDQRNWLNQVNQNVQAAETQVLELKSQLDHKIEELGSNWSLERLESAEATLTTHNRMVRCAHSYRSVLSRRAKLKRRHQQMSKLCQQRLADVNEQVKQLGNRSIEQALEATRQRLADLQDLAQLKLRDTELDQRCLSISGQLERLEQRPALPKWVTVVLCLFGMIGLTFILVGLVTGATMSVIAGTSYALLGFTGVGIAYGLQRYAEFAADETIEQLQNEIRESEVRLRETREAIARFVGDDLAEDHLAGDGDETDRQPTEADLIRQTVRRLTELEILRETQEHVQSSRRKLSELRSQFQTVRRDVSLERQNWCELLTQLGFSETVRIEEAFETWQRVAEANEQRRLYESAAHELRNDRKTFDSFRQQVEELGQRMQCPDIDDCEPMDVLDLWEEKLQDFERIRVERHRLGREEKVRRCEAGEYQALRDELQMQISALLVRAGASNREEFEQRAQWSARRQDLEESLVLTHEELTSASRTEPDLAIVEEDLKAYNAEENNECLQVLNLELEDLDGDLQQAFEKLGSVKQAVKELESDRRSTTLRFERSLIRGALQRAAEEWCAVQLASQSVFEMRSRFERSCQPATLAASSAYLEQLTGGKYKNVWTPLGERHLCVDDDRQHTFRVEQLSNGTREQLFLAIRLAIVNDFTSRGIELPMVLDDVIVNFDQLRTEAAVDTLIEFAANGQQILFFTCHLHLAHLFESKGIEPIWLPRHNPPIEKRRAG